MLRLVNENFPDGDRWLSKAFEICCTELGIAGCRGTVVVRAGRLDEDSVSERRPGGTSKRTRGCTSHDHKGHILIELEERPCPCGKCDIMSTFCHEMVHVKQVLKDNLHNIKEAGKMMSGTIFKGEYFPTQAAYLFLGEEAYGELPWEIEAEEWQPKLFEKVKAALR